MQRAFFGRVHNHVHHNRNGSHKYDNNMCTHTGMITINDELIIKELKGADYELSNSTS